MLFRLKLLLLSVSAAALGFCGWILWFALSPIELAAPTVEFSIRPGSTLRGATRQIMEAGVPMPDWKFILLARVNGANAGIKAGSYQVSEGVTPLQLVRKIMRGEYAQAEILIVEGWNFRQMREALNAHVDLKHDSASLSEAQIMGKLGAPDMLPEGMFFPDTYVFAKDSSDLAVLGRARRVMKKQLESAWAGRAPDLPMTDPYEALILASLVAGAGALHDPPRAQPRRVDELAPRRPRRGGEPMTRGKFITLEGIDGAGKSTHVEGIADFLRRRGKDIAVTREPGGTPLGEKLRELVLSQPMDVETEALLVFAARREHIAQVIAPALSAGRWVISDRFTDATYAYHGAGRGIPAQKIAALDGWAHDGLQTGTTRWFES